MDKQWPLTLHRNRFTVVTGRGAEANPQGCQKVAGGRSGQGGNDHRKAVSESEHPGGVPELHLAPIE